jgi:hypothetical protein
MKPRGIIIEPKKMVYFYLPKTSCTTLKTFFADLLDLEIPIKDGTEMDIHGQEIGFDYTHVPLEGYYNFAYVRNPFDRLMSCYSQKIYKSVDRKVFPQTDMFYTGMEFEVFIDTILSIKDKERHYMLHSELLPEGVITHKMEGDLFLKFLEPLNVSEKINLWTTELKEKVYEHYRNDFIRFGYEKN